MDLNKIKQKLQDLESSKSGGSKYKWSPQPGTHIIRLMPYIHNPDWPFIELAFYYKLKKATILSPTSFGKPDPVQEFVDQLKSTGDKDDWKTAVNIQAKPRTYVPILVRGKEEEGIKFWGFGKQIYQELLKVIDDPDYGDISHPKTGRDIVVEIVKTDKNWPDILIRVKPKETVCSTNKEVLDLCKEMPKIESLWVEPTYDELKVMLENYLSNEEDAGPDIKAQAADPTDKFLAEMDDLDLPELKSDSKSMTTSPKRQPAAKKEMTQETVTSDFDELFNS